MADAMLIDEAPPPPTPAPVPVPLASSVIIETSPAAATDAAPAGGAALTLPASAMHFAEHTESGSDSGQDEHPQEGSSSQREQLGASSSPTDTNGETGARSSPPPNCAICLSRCRRKCFTDSCMHQFCFKCLCEWSKIKAECPLCKQPFKTIIHNVRTQDDYDRYPVQSSVPEHRGLSAHVRNIRRQLMLHQMQNQGVPVDEAIITDESEDGLDVRVQPLRMHLLSFYRDDPSVRTGSLSELWRYYVYDQKLYALPVIDTLTGHFRECGARFYRENPAQMHRLIPWIHRDLGCLLRHNLHEISAVVTMLAHDLLPIVNISSRTFRRRLARFLGERTNHFIHELHTFARSPYDMIGYDRVVQYSALITEELEVDLPDLAEGASATMSTTTTTTPSSAVATTSSSSSTLVETATSQWNRLAHPSTSVIVTNPSATHSFSVTMATDGSELPGISIRRTTTSNVGSQTVAINLSMRRPANEIIEIGDDTDAAANAEVAAINDSSSSGGPSASGGSASAEAGLGAAGGTSSTGRRHAGASLPISAHIELESSDCSNNSDDDECVFVLERKPPHLRTPELVSLDSNSDSDVVFVDEQKTTPPTTATAAANPPAQQQLDQVDVEDAPTGMYLGASTSTGVCSTAGKSWKRVLEEARRQKEERSGRPMRKTRAQRWMTTNRSFGVASHSSTSSSHSWSSTSDGSSSSSNSEDDQVPSTRSKRHDPRKLKAKKRPSTSKARTQFKSKRSRLQATEEQEQRDQQSSKSSDSSGESSADSCAEQVAPDSHNSKSGASSNSSSSSFSDDDSKANLRLSALRNAIRAAAEASQDRQSPKPEFKSEQSEQPDESLVKLRRDSSSSNTSTYWSNSVASTTMPSPNTTTCSELSLFRQNDEDARLGSCSDISNVLRDVDVTAETEPEMGLAIDVVGDGPDESNEPEQLMAEPAQQLEEEHIAEEEEEEDEDDDDEEQNVEHDDEDAAVEETDVSDSEPDADPEVDPDADPDADPEVDPYADPTPDMDAY